ncbi:MAG: TonB-dependent receptor [Polyangiaceae bacterium]
MTPYEVRSRSSRGRAFVVLCLAFVAFATPGVARADQRTEARKIFTRGMTAIQKGRLEEGIALLRQAYDTLPNPNVLYNLGRAYAAIGDREAAVEHFERYVASGPDDKDEVLAEVKRLEAEIEAAKPKADPPPTPPSTTEPTPAVVPPNAPSNPSSNAIPAPVRPAVPEMPPSKSDVVYEETVVTASRQEQSPLHAPSSTTVITEQDIRLSGITKIPELLRRVAGVDVMQTTAGQSDVSIRGFNTRLSNKVLVLVDGRSVFLDWIGATFWELLPVGVTDIERIEVARGPGSALYGADAFSGVVNIITKPPGEGGTRILVGAGDSAQVWGGARAAGRQGDFAYSLSAGYARTPRWSRVVPDGRTDVDVARGVDDADAETSRIDLRMSRRIGRHVGLALGGGITQGKLQFVSTGALKDSLLDRGRAGDVTFSVTLPKVRVRTFYNFTMGDVSLAYAYAGRPLYPTHLTANVVDVEPVFSEKFETGPVTHALTVGVNYRLRNASSSYTGGDRTEHHYGAFVQDGLGFGRYVEVVLGGRVDYVPYVKEMVPSPRVSLLVHPSPKSTIRASFATAFRKPTFVEGYTSFALASPLGDVQSVTDTQRLAAETGQKLRPERILATELGYLHRESEFVDLEVNGFWNRVTDLIALTPNRPTSPSSRAADPGFGFDPATGRYVGGVSGFANNCADYDVFGGEVGARVYPTSGVDLFANYALNLTEIQKSPSCATADDQRTSRHKVNAGVQVRTRFGVDGEVAVHFVSAQKWAERELDSVRGDLVTTVLPVDAYALLNARLGWRFVEDRLEVSVVGTNLAGNVHQEHPFGAFVGRRVMGFFGVRF